MTAPGKPLDLDGMEAVARAATPGPWTGDRVDGTVKYDVLAPCPHGRLVVISGDNNNSDSGPYGIREPEDERFILTFDPPTVLALIQTQRELMGALKPFAAVAGPVKGEVGRPTYLDVIIESGGTEELAVTTVFDTGGRGAVLWADDFRAARAAITKALGEQPL